MPELIVPFVEKDALLAQVQLNAQNANLATS
jgi:hypothetical protein